MEVTTGEVEDWKFSAKPENGQQMIQQTQQFTV
jgi:hypothetical protein